jgi:thiamine pyrophosphate-dependent acetolactate synthase large subunit-like protein
LLLGSRRSWRSPIDRALDGREAAKAHARTILAWTDTAARRCRASFQYGEAVKWLRERLPAEAIVTNGAGNYAGWIHRHHRFRKLRRAAGADLGLDGLWGAGGGDGQAAAPGLASSSAFAGDGCFLMNGQEFATAVQYDAFRWSSSCIDNAHVRHHPHASGARISRPRRRPPC